jgi:hypothetical protein
MQEQAAPDWNAYTLVASIEEARLTEGNPPVPFELSLNYERAWAALLPIAIRDLGQSNDDLVVQGAFAVVAHAKGQRSLAAFALCTEDERREMLDD